MKKIISLVMLTILMIQISAQNAPYYKKDGQFVKCPTDRATILHPGDTIFNACYNSLYNIVIFDPVPVFWRYYGSSSFEQKAYITLDSSGFIGYQYPDVYAPITWIRVVLLEFDNIQDIDTCVNSAYHLTHFVDTTLQDTSLSTQTFYEEYWKDEYLDIANASSIDSVDHEGTFNLLYGISRVVIGPNPYEPPIYETYFTVNLNIKEVDTVTIDTCSTSYTWNENGSTYNSSGIYDFSDGCDTIRLILNLNATYSHTEYDTICDGDTFIWQGNSYTASGSYTASYYTEDGCDSIYILNLTVNPTYSFTETVSSDTPYLWHDSTYTVSGTYMVSYTTVNGCDSIYTLNLTSHVSVSEFETQSFVLYPNPVESILNFEEGIYWIYDLTGRLVLTGNSTSADVSSLKAGTYIFRSEKFSTKFIKK